MKHMDGIVAHINGHKSQREDIRGRIKDSIVYLTLYWAMVEGEESVKWGTEEFLADSGFIDSNFNPETGEVTA